MTTFNFDNGSDRWECTPSVKEYIMDGFVGVMLGDIQAMFLQMMDVIKRHNAVVKSLEQFSKQWDDIALTAHNAWIICQKLTGMKRQTSPVVKIR